MPDLNRPLLRRIGAVALAAVVAAAPMLALPAPAFASAGPTSVADLASQLIDSVVNISTTQTVGGGDDSTLGGDGDATPQMPQVPPGTPFEEFFNEFFKNKKGDNKPRKTASLGSGFVIDASGIIVTNNHVIDGADTIEVNFTDGTKLKAKLLGRDKKVDLAVRQPPADVAGSKQPFAGPKR